MSLFRSYEPVLIVLLREHTFVQRRSPSKHEWIERFAMTETLRYSGDRSEEGETMTKLEALSDAFEKFKAEQSSVNSSLHSELISLQSQIEGLQRMTARIAASNYETLAIMVSFSHQIRPTSDPRKPNWQKISFTVEWISFSSLNMMQMLRTARSSVQEQKASHSCFTQWSYDNLSLVPWFYETAYCPARECLSMLWCYIDLLQGSLQQINW